MSEYDAQAEYDNEKYHYEKDQEERHIHEQEQTIKQLESELEKCKRKCEVYEKALMECLKIASENFSPQYFGDIIMITKQALEQAKGEGCQ